MSALIDIRRRGRVRWGFIGCGDVTEVKSGPAFARVANSSVSVVMRRDADKARDYAERHGVPRWTTDADDVILADDVDAVYVATPPDSHAEYAVRVAAAGKPVYIEKPLARTGAEGATITEACEAAGVPLFVGYYRRALPRHERVRELLAQGAIGEVTRVHLDLQWRAPASEREGGWRWDPDIAGDGLLLDLGSHALDLLDHWLDPISDVSGYATRRLPWSRVTDEVVGAFTFANGVLGSATWGFGGAYLRDSLSVFGANGSICVPVFTEGPLAVTVDGSQVRNETIEQPKHVHEPLLTLIVGELLGGESRCPSTGTSALRTQIVMDKLLQR